MEATQNTDVFAEVMGILNACAVSLLKVSTDLRLMSSGPEAGIGEIRLPERQAGSSIMPGKVNPVIPEAVSQVALLVMGHTQVVAQACARGELELNAFMPLIADCLLQSCDLLARACEQLATLCVAGMEANEARCRAHVDGSTALATALIPAIGYERACEIARKALLEGRTVREIVLSESVLTPEAFDALVTPEAVCRLGMPDLRP